MELSIFSRTYHTTDLAETCGLIHADGMRHTQFNLANAGMKTLPDEFDEQRIEAVRFGLKVCGITADALTGTFNLIDPDLDAREAGIGQFGIQCRIAKALGIPIVTLCTGSKHPSDKWTWHEDNLLASSWDDLLRSTERILKDAEANGIVLGVETEASNIVNTAQKARRYLDTFGSQNLKIIMDGANLFRAGETGRMRETLNEAFELLGPDIAIAHAKDLGPSAEHPFAAAGKGVLDFPYYLKLLKNSGYDGTLVMHGLEPEEVPESFAFLTEALKNA